MSVNLFSLPGSRIKKAFCRLKPGLPGSEGISDSNDLEEFTKRRGRFGENKNPYPGCAFLHLVLLEQRGW